MQGGAVCVLLLTRKDVSVSPWLGFTTFGIGLAAFLCSAPGLAALRRSDIRGLPRYVLMGIHALWFVSGGLILLGGLLIKVIFPWIQCWVAA
jgi:hypothetical protein